MRWASLATGMAVLLVRLADTPSYPDPLPPRPEPHSYKTHEVDGFGHFFLMLAPARPGSPAPEWRNGPRGDFPGTVYRSSGLYRNDGSGRPLWEVDWYATRVDPAWNGVHAVRLEPMPVGGDDEAVGFTARGRLLRSYPVSELVARPEALDRSAGHLRWLAGSEYDRERRVYRVRTTEGRRLRFDVATGNILDDAGR